MIVRNFTLILAIFSTLISTVQTCEESSVVFDYETLPYQPFDYQHVDLEITLDPAKALVSGVAEYTFSPKVDGLTEMLLHTSESAIEAVVLDGEEADYYISSDSLLISFADSSVAGTEHILKISWQSNSTFGLLQDYKGNLWSSKNPLAHHHWFPVFDHPRVELTVDATFNIPNETEVLFNGDIADVAPASQSRKKVHYQTERTVPVTGLGFAMGDFVISEMTAGFTKIRLFSPENGYTEEERNGLVVEAARIKRAVENELSFEYPWDGLNVVILPDNIWEERTHGTGTVYLYENLGSLTNQLKRGIYSQWFGEYLRQEQFIMGEESVDQMLASVLHFSLEDSAITLQNPDSMFTVDVWNNFQTNFILSDFYDEIFRKSLKDFVRIKQGVTPFSEYEAVWYDQTGVPFNQIPLIEPAAQMEHETNDEYLVDAIFDEMNSELKLAFTLQEGSGEELSSLTLVEHQFDGTETHEVIFTGTSDTAIVQLGQSVEFITFEDKSFATDHLQYGNFPLYFLLNQLRSPEASERALAATLLPQHSDNPDLQLALSDILAFEEDADVIAAINASMAKITAGASGTEEKFLEGLQSDSKEVKLASIQALANYPENERVVSAIRTEVLRGEDEVFTTALEVYQHLAGRDELLSLAKRLQRSDSTGVKVLHVFFSSDSLHQNTESIEIVESYLDTKFPYTTRKYALEFLKEYDLDANRWNDRLEALSKDRDPRIRFLAVEAIPMFSSTSEALVSLKSAMLEESDPRVLLLIEGMIEELDE